MSNAAVTAATTSRPSMRTSPLWPGWAPPSSAVWSSSSPISGCCSSSSFRSSSSSRSRCRRRRSPCRPTRRCSISATAFPVFSPSLKQLSIDNYVWLTQDALYFNAYVTSVIIAAISTVLTLLVGYPIAYGMARAPATHPPDPADAGDPAVLDLVPDPGLRLDRHPQARGAAQPAAARHRHHQTSR